MTRPLYRAYWRMPFRTDAGRERSIAGEQKTCENGQHRVRLGDLESSVGARLYGQLPDCHPLLLVFGLPAFDSSQCMCRSPVKEWQVGWLALGTITLNGTDTTVKRLDKNMKTLNADSLAILANNGICAVQSYCPQNKPADLSLFCWRPVPVYNVFVCIH